MQFVALSVCFSYQLLSHGLSVVCVCSWQQAERKPMFSQFLLLWPNSANSIILNTHPNGSTALEIAVYICEASLVLIKAEFVSSLRVTEVVPFSF